MVNGTVYLYRAVDQFGQVIDVHAAEKRDLAASVGPLPRHSSKLAPCWGGWR
jgi:transposase-like protein